MDVSALRETVRRYMGLQLHETACFWADKAVSLSGGAPEDLLQLAQCYLLTQQPRRAVQLLRRSGRLPTDQQCRYLAARALLTTAQPDEALQVLDSAAAGAGPEPAHVLLLRGRLHERLENRPAAAQWYRKALCADVLCQEALDALLGHQMLTAAEERQLLAQLPAEEQLPPADAAAVRQLYQLQLSRQPAGEPLPAPLQHNDDVAACRAEQLYTACDYAACLRLTGEVLERDPDHPRCLPVHLVCLLERRDTTALFQLAHRLVQAYPERALAWFAVGVYYYTAGRMEPARRYLSKATALEPSFGPAWLAYGHSFALENEHDQAISAYFRGSQLMRGCHLPLLYVGLEYALTNNARLAQQFFSQALAMAPDDPFVLHELGTLLFAGRDYAGAERHLSAALRIVQHQWHAPAAHRWEPLLNNLGHTFRKLGRYAEALEMHERALVLEPHSAATHAAIGYTHALMERPARAVDAFHKALSLRRDDAFSTQMLSLVLEQLVSGEAGQGEPLLAMVEPERAAASSSLRLTDCSDDMSLELDDSTAAT